MEASDKASSTEVPKNQQRTDQYIRALDDKCMYSSELMELCMEKEETRMDRMSASGRGAMPAPLRQVAMRCLAVKLRRVDLDDKLPQASVMLDTLWATSKEALTVEQMPSYCAGLCTLIQKNDDSCVDLLDDFQRTTKMFAGYFQKAGVLQGEVQTAPARRVEQSILKALKWEVSPTSHLDWTNSFCDRLNVVYGGALRESILWILQTTTAHWADMLVEQNVSTSELSPKDAAMALFCLSMVKAGLLSASQFGLPESVETETSPVSERSQESLLSWLDIVLCANQTAIRVAIGRYLQVMQA